MVPFCKLVVARNTFSQILRAFSWGERGDVCSADDLGVSSFALSPF